MSQKLALKIILVVALSGLMFSGYLSYQELFLGNCQNPIVSCGVNQKPILGYPACVYGFFMYLVVTLTSFWGLRSKE